MPRGIGRSAATRRRPADRVSVLWPMNNRSQPCRAARRGGRSGSHRRHRSSGTRRSLLPLPDLQPAATDIDIAHIQREARERPAHLPRSHGPATSSKLLKGATPRTGRVSSGAAGRADPHAGGAPRGRGIALDRAPIPVPSPAGAVLSCPSEPDRSRRVPHRPRPPTPQPAADLPAAVLSGHHRRRTTFGPDACRLARSGTPPDRNTHRCSQPTVQSLGAKPSAERQQPP